MFVVDFGIGLACSKVDVTDKERDLVVCIQSSPQLIAKSLGIGCGNSYLTGLAFKGRQRIQILIVGMNKITPDVTSAVARVRNMAAPPNGVRLGLSTPCAKFGKCHDCYSPDCMCCELVITRKSRIPGRIKVILVGEELGY